MQAWPSTSCPVDRFRNPLARSLADLQRGLSLQVQVDGLDNLSGTWVMALNDAIAQGRGVTSYGSGPAGAVWKLRARARQNKKHHAQLVCDFYVAALSNPDGSLKGLRVLGKVKLPYYDTTSKMNWVSFSRFQLCSSDQGAVLRDCFGKHFGPARAYRFQWISGSTFAANHGYKSSNDYGYCTRLSTTGALPSGLSTDRSYFTADVTASTIAFGSRSCHPDWSPVGASDSGSGVHTATPYPFLAYFGALFTAGHSGLWDFVQGAGSDTADTPLRCEIDKKYWLSTGLLPPYDLKLRAASGEQASYWPNAAGPVTRFLSQTGERPDLGIMPAWHARHFLTQAAVDERTARVVSLVGGQFSIGLESAGSRSYPVANNGRYGGMPAPNPQFVWNPGVTSQGFPHGDTTDANVLIAGFSQQDSSHMPQFNYYPYLLTGEPCHLDMLLEHANNAVYSRYSPMGTASISPSAYSLGSGERNLHVPPNAPTYGDTIGGGEQRADAWASALLAAAAGICPDNHPECRSYKRYFSDMNTSTWTAALDIFHALPPFAKRYGLWHVTGGSWQFIDHWQMAYLGTAVSLAACATENRHALAALDGLVKWFDHVVAEFGGWHAGAYMTIIKTGNASGAPLVTSDTEVAFYGPNVNWTAGGRFTVAPVANYTPANGDKFMFTDPADALGQTTPAGFAKYTPYYVVNLSGRQFDLSPHPSGLAVPLTDLYSGTNAFFIVSTRPPASGSISGIGNPDSYNTEVLGMLRYAVAAGAAVQAATLADLSHRTQAAGTNLASDPRWAMRSTFVQ